jgi:hypothetical protein
VHTFPKETSKIFSAIFNQKKKKLNPTSCQNKFNIKEQSTPKIMIKCQQKKNRVKM